MNDAQLLKLVVSIHTLWNSDISRHCDYSTYIEGSGIAHIYVSGVSVLYASNLQKLQGCDRPVY